MMSKSDIGEPSRSAQEAVRPRRDPLAVGDHFLDLALRCYAAAMLSDGAITRHVLARLPGEIRWEETVP